jgi:hypothetical protein
MASLLRSRAAWVFVLVAAAGVLTYRWLNPPDRVEVNVGKFPPSTRLFCLLADGSDGPQAMWWSHDKVGPHDIHPKDGSHTELDEWERMRAHRRVMWRAGRRYGVLTRDHDDRWRVTWLEPDEVGLRWHLLGGGEASIELPGKDRGETASEGLLDAVGFDREVRQQWEEWLK